MARPCNDCIPECNDKMENDAWHINAMLTMEGISLDMPEALRSSIGKIVPIKNVSMTHVGYSGLVASSKMTWTKDFKKGFDDLVAGLDKVAAGFDDMMDVAASVEGDADVNAPEDDNDFLQWHRTPMVHGPKQNHTRRTADESLAMLLQAAPAFGEERVREKGTVLKLPTLTEILMKLGLQPEECKKFTDLLKKAFGGLDIDKSLENFLAEVSFASCDAVWVRQA